MNVQAAVVRECSQLNVETVELEPPKRGEVRVRMAAAGVCHSDLHTMRCELRARPPLVLGHEGAGTVDAVGEGVESVQPGQRVMINWLPSCDSCANCQSGHPSLCETFPATTFQGLLADRTSRFKTQDGLGLKQLLSAATMSECTVVTEAGVIPLPDDVPFEVAAITGCAVMTGVGAVMNTAQVVPGSSAALIGCGGVGLSILLGLKMAGCYPLIAVDVMDSKLEFARSLGATHTVNAKNEDAVETIQKLTGKGAGYVFDSVGNAATIAQAVAAAGPYGAATVTGMHSIQDKVPIPADALIFQNKRLLGSFVGSSRPKVDLPKLLELYRGGVLDLDALITRRYPLEDVNKAFDDMEAGEVVRGVLVFD